jgi:hypothetical protein
VLDPIPPDLAQFPRGILPHPTTIKHLFLMVILDRSNIFDAPLTFVNANALSRDVFP